MFHYFVGSIEKNLEKTLLKNDFFGFEVLYEGKQKKGEFFIYPQFDQNTNTYRYVAFDNMLQKNFFEKFHKISGIGIKTAFVLSGLPIADIQKAVENFDIKFFQSIPGIGAKTAKRILIELKNSFSDKDISKLNIDDKLLKNITKSLKPLGYEPKKIQSLLESCPIELNKEKLQEIIKRIMSNYNN